MADQLSKAQCILLAVNYASESQIQPLQDLFQLRSAEALQPELLLRIILTYLPTMTPAAQYIPLVQALISGDSTAGNSNSTLDVSSVEKISPAAADKKLRKLTLLPLSPPSYPANGPEDLLTRFLCHRAYRIDEETGLITLIPDLITPFLDHSEYLRLWYLSVVLPLARLRHDYHPDLDLASGLSLDAFEKLDSYRGTDLLLSGAKATPHEITSEFESSGTVARDLKGLVGPWLYGKTSSKRRKLNGQSQATEPSGAADNTADTGVEKTSHSWEQVYTWLVKKAADDFFLATNAVEDWDGPEDVDLGDVAHRLDLMDERELNRLRRRYAQAAFACCYAVQENTPAAVSGAHGILVRLASLLDFEPPPDLATSVEQLPRIDRHAKPIEDADSMVTLLPDNLMKPYHLLTSPILPCFMLLQMLVYSAYQLAGLGHSISIVNVAKLRFFATEDEQMRLLQRILHSLSAQGKKDDQQWLTDRGRILWLWNWNIDPEEGALRGSGVFGNVTRETLEKEILTAMLVTGNCDSIGRLYLGQSDATMRLTREDLEETILAEAMRCYDNASNGNRTRGNMKKASDIINTFKSSFVGSLGFEQASALIAATHSMSFYSLTLQYGVPFQPVNIRVSTDPIALLETLLEQNPKSYTKLDDLIGIGQNLALATPTPLAPNARSKAESDRIAKHAERRVVYMCTSSALAAHDFDTAYSYLINRLNPSSTPAASTNRSGGANGAGGAGGAEGEEDDTSWRAALLAGRYRPPHSDNNNLPAQIRLLSQRTELLSLALRLAPLPALTEILNVYRRCEEEMAALTALQAEAEERHDDILARQRGGAGAGAGPTTVPGGFEALGVNEGRVYGQERRELGRFGAGGYNSTETSRSRTRDGQGRDGARAKQLQGRSRGPAGHGGSGEEEAPVGLFDLAQGAAAALRRNAFPLRGVGSGSGPGSGEGAAGKRREQAEQPRIARVGHDSPAEEMMAPPFEAVGGRAGAGKDGGADEDWGAEWDEHAPSSAAKSRGGDGEEDGDAWGWNDDGDGGGMEAEGGWGSSSMMSGGSGGERTSGERVRKRDMVANAVTGGLASGIGWVLGATPVNAEEERRRRERGE